MGFFCLHPNAWCLPELDEKMGNRHRQMEERAVDRMKEWNCVCCIRMHIDVYWENTEFINISTLISKHQTVANNFNYYHVYSFLHTQTQQQSFSSHSVRCDGSATFALSNSFESNMTKVRGREFICMHGAHQWNFALIYCKTLGVTMVNSFSIQSVRA